MTPENQNRIIAISIHAPREGGDEELVERCARYAEISIHAPREGGDIFSPSGTSSWAFQSTPPARGATD